MGFVSGLLGTAGGVNGTGISAPQQANILNPTTVDQANTAYTQNQNALAQQQAFLQATQAQNGLGNQSSVFNQLQNVANGTGPNPAQAMLAQSTGANVASQAALMAGQRGSGANPGLIARQAAMQGANTQQQAAGQAATMQANQSLGALNSLGSMANTQVAQQAAATGANTSAQQGEQSQLLNSIAAQNNANVGMQSNINNANSGLASATMQGQQNMLGNIAGGIGSALHLASGGTVPRMHYADPQSPVSYDPNNTDQVNYDSPNAAVASMPGGQLSQPQLAQPGQQPAASSAPGPKSRLAQNFDKITNGGKLTGTGIAGNVIGLGIGTALKGIFGHNGTSDVNNAAAQGQSQTPPNQAGGAMDNTSPAPASNAGDMDSSQLNAARGGKVPAMVSPGERYLPPKEVAEVVKGKKNPMKAGEKIPGKPKVGGAKNSYANDTVPKTLEEGGIVIPRSITQGPNPHWAAMKFVHETLRKGKK